MKRIITPSRWSIALCRAESLPDARARRLTANRNAFILGLVSAFMSVHQRSALIFFSEYSCLSAVQKNSLTRGLAPSIPPPFLPRQSPVAKGGQAVCKEPIKMIDWAVPCTVSARRSRSSANGKQKRIYLGSRISVHQCASAVGFGLY